MNRSSSVRIQCILSLAILSLNAFLATCEVQHLNREINRAGVSNKGRTLEKEDEWSALLEEEEVLDLEVNELFVERHLNGTAPKKHPPKNHASSSSSSSSGGSSGGSSTSYENKTYNINKQNKPPAKAGYLLKGAAALVVVGAVASLYNRNRDRVIVTDSPSHPLAGSVAVRMERFNKLAGTASPEARGAMDDDDSNTIYVNMSNGGANEV